MVYKHINTGDELYHYLNQTPLSIVKVYSNNCAPCKSYAPQYEQMSQRYQYINFLDMNMRSNLVKVSAVPTTLIIKNNYLEGGDGCFIVDKILGGDVTELETKLRSFLQLNNSFQ